MTLYLEDLERMKCCTPDCDHDSHDGLMYFHSLCHPLEPTWVHFDGSTGELVIECAVCKEDVARVVVASIENKEREIQNGYYATEV